MKTFKTVIFFLITLLFWNCEKSESKIDPPEIRGVWEYEEANFIIKTNADVEINDFFGEPWKGKIVFTENGTEIIETSFDFYKDNVFGNFHLIGDSVVITQAYNSLEIIYNQKIYFIDYVNTGKLNELLIEGTAFTNENESLEITGSIRANVIQCKAGEVYSLKDGYAFEKANFLKLNFQSGGNFTGEILDIDVLFGIEGEWTLSGNNLNVMYDYASNKRIIDKEYQVHISAKELSLFEELEQTQTILNQIGVNEDVLSSVIYSLDFVRDSDN